MTLGNLCKQHKVPRDICAKCIGATQERQRIIDILHLAQSRFAGHATGYIEMHIDDIIDLIEKDTK